MNRKTQFFVKAFSMLLSILLAAYLGQHGKSQIANILIAVIAIGLITYFARQAWHVHITHKIDLIKTSGAEYIITVLFWVPLVHVTANPDSDFSKYWMLGLLILLMVTQILARRKKKDML